MANTSGIPDSLLSLVNPNVKYYDPNGNQLTMREQKVGTAQQWRAEETAPTIYGMSQKEYQQVTQATHKQVAKQQRQFEQKEANFQKLQDEAKSKTAAEFRNMSMTEYKAYRESVLGPETHKPMGVSLRTGSGFLSDRYEATLTDFDRWKNARDRFISGDITDIDLVLKHVREGEDGYSKIVDMEIAEERALKKEGDDGVHKHWFSWSRWSVARWLGAWFHR